MTREDTKKALELCIDDEDCEKCPYVDHYRCTRALQKGALALITEQEKEIERLKSEIIKQDQVIIERNFELVELEDKIKQAKIDILNKLKERLYSIFVTKSSPLGDITVEDIADDIDELIEEVKDNG